MAGAPPGFWRRVASRNLGGGGGQEAGEQVRRSRRKQSRSGATRGGVRGTRHRIGRREVPAPAGVLCQQVAHCAGPPGGPREPQGGLGGQERV